MPVEPSADHTAAARRRLAHLAGMDAHTARTESRILAAAEDRLSKVGGEADKLRHRVFTDDKAAEAYEAAITEAAQLRTVIATARAHGA